MAFSASEAAFEGFRVIRREPVTLVIWAVLLLVLTGVFVAVAAPVFQGFASNMVPGATPNATQLAAVGNLMWLYLAALPIYLVIYSVFSAAIYRAVLRPEEKGLARLRFGGDELRLMGLYLVLGLVLFVGVVLLAFIAGIVVAAVIYGTGSKGAAGIVWMVTVMYLVMIVAWAWLGVKFSFAGPMTFARRRISIFGSWGATKGRFWPLLGCYALAFVFAFLILLVDYAISAALMLGAAGGSVSRLATSIVHPNLSTAMSLLSPIFLIRMVVGVLFGVVMWTVALAPSARAYREIVAPRPEDQAETFA